MEIKTMIRADKKTTKVPKPKSNKLNLDLVFLHILELLRSRYAEDISFSLISQKTKTPRSTLYYYFGSDKTKLIQEAVRFGMSQITRLWQFSENDMKEKFKNWDDFQNWRFHRSIEIFSEFPWIADLYFRYRNHSDFIGVEIRYFEESYLKRNAEAWRFYYNNQVPPDRLRLTTYIKLGILWGISQEPNLWLNKKDSLSKLAGDISKLVEEI
jgi:AcrR family transcriptional regulator